MIDVLTDKKYAAYWKAHRFERWLATALGFEVTCMVAGSPFTLGFELGYSHGNIRSTFGLGRSNPDKPWTVLAWDFSCCSHWWNTFGKQSGKPKKCEKCAHEDQLYEEARVRVVNSYLNGSIFGFPSPSPSPPTKPKKAKEEEKPADDYKPGMGPLGDLA